MSSAGIAVSDLDGSNGFRINAVFGNAPASRSIALGDVNGDGFDDIIFVSAPTHYETREEIHVVYGAASGFGAEFDAASLDGANGVTIIGTPSSVAAGQDVNGDGIDDMIVANAVIFGRLPGFGIRYDSGGVKGQTGFLLDGLSAQDRGDAPIAFAGDLNGDGFADIVVGASGADPGGKSDAGESYVVFGKASGFGTSVDVKTLDGTNGFRITGIDAGDFSGAALSSAGDINGDGYGDLIIGADGATSNGKALAGETYVLFGRATGFAASVDLATLDGTDGFKLAGIGYGDRSGHSVASAGDVNGDGIDDIIVGAHGGDRFDGLLTRNTGETYIVFGRASGFQSTLDLNALDGSTGFRIDGILENEMTGISVSAAGDFNGDGIGDILVGTAGSGASYLVFGQNAGFSATLDLANLDGTNGMAIHGVGGSVTGGGDINGDGYDDIVIGPAIGQNSGSAHVIFGGPTLGSTPSVPNRTIDGQDGRDDSLVGGAGDDVLDGGTGADSMFGYLGNDVFHIDNEGDRAIEDADGGIDVVYSSVSLRMNTPINHFANIERFVLTDSAFMIIGRDDTGEIMVGNALGNHLRGNGGDDEIDGAAGNDVIIGGSGNDTLRGGAGDDFLFVDSANDVVIELVGEGTDRVLSSVDHTLGAHVEQLRLFGADALVGTGNDLDNLLLAGQGPASLYGLGGNDTLAGTVHGDVLEGGEGADVAQGRAGDDVLRGGIGNDTLMGGNGNDTLLGGADDDRLRGDAGRDFVDGQDGNDMLFGGYQADELHGGAGDDVLCGEDGKDVLNGGDGIDVLIGGADRDILTGGGSADCFQFIEGDFAGTTIADADFITDFNQAEGDCIRLSQIDAVPGGTDSAFVFVDVAAFSRSAGELRYEIAGNYTLVQGDIDGDGLADFAIALDGQINLTASDFIL